MRRHLIFLAAMMAYCFSALGSPARPGVTRLVQADGTTLTVRLEGDEFFHQYLTEDEYPLIEKNGLFHYADYDFEGRLIDSGLKASECGCRKPEEQKFLSDIDKSTLRARIAKRALSLSSDGHVRMTPGKHRFTTERTLSNDGPPYQRGYGLFPELRFPAYGSRKAIVILVEYKDVKFNNSYDPHDYFSRMLNADGFSDLGATGSAAEYFKVNSNGAFMPQFDVYGPVTLAHNMEYYGYNGVGGQDARPAEMVVDACQQLDATVDFSEYDCDGDGIVDNVFVFYAGRGEATGGGPDTVWPHSFNLAEAGWPVLYFDNVRVHTYGCTNEWRDDRPDGVGTFIHEFSHVMGLPDLYSTFYTGAFTPGEWSALDGGAYNNDGMTPPYYGAFERYALGWMEPLAIDASLSAVLPPITDNTAGIIKTDSETEFFLVENRQQEGWDRFVPGHGMLVWHIKYDPQIWSQNSVNNIAGRQYVDIEEADGTESNTSRDGDCFPGVSEKTSFTAETYPSLRTWTGKAINLPITDIAEQNGLVSFNILGGASVPEIPEVEVLPPSEVTNGSFMANWVKKEGYDHVISVYSKDADGSLVYYAGFEHKNLGEADRCVVKGLKHDMTYYYTVLLSSGWHHGPASAEVEVTTGRQSIDFYGVEATPATNVTTTSFDANWLKLEDAQEYYLTVFRKVPDKPYVDFCDFSDGLETMNGWATTSTLLEESDDYSGESAPSLRLGAGKELVSNQHDDYISGLSFWHRGNATSAKDRIAVVAVTHDGENTVREIRIEKAAGGCKTVIDDLPEHTTSVIVRFVRQGTKGYVAIDDVTLLYGMQTKHENVTDYDGINVGNQLSHRVIGLSPDSDYFYFVRASDGHLFSKPSEDIYIRTNSDTAIEDILGNDETIRVDGREVSVSDGEHVVVYDFQGVAVASGQGRVSIPSEGHYVVVVPARCIAVKVYVR